MNLVSDCCQRPLAIGTRTEYPLGGSTWGIHHNITICDGCGKECTFLEECEVCGEIGCFGECENELSNAGEDNRESVVTSEIPEQL